VLENPALDAIFHRLRVGFNQELSGIFRALTKSDPMEYSATNNDDVSQ
jgi:hypothetical protein